MAKKGTDLTGTACKVTAGRTKARPVLTPPMRKETYGAKARGVARNVEPISALVKQ
jgi:hypothetical protein